MPGALLIGETEYLTPAGAQVITRIDGTLELNGSPVLVNGSPLTSGALVFLGAWSSVTAYVVGNIVTFGGVAYVAIANGTNHQPDTSPAFWTSLVGSGALVPPGGTTGQVLTKASNADGDTTWSDKLAAVAAHTILANLTAGTAEPTAASYAAILAALGIQNIALTGSGADLVAASVTNAKLANMAAGTIKANLTGGSATPSDVTIAAITAAINVFTSTLAGTVPASGGGTANFLRADGSWAPPPAGVPATTVTGPDAFGDSPVVGTGTKFARDDHNHGLPAQRAPATTVTGPDGFSAPAVVGTSLLFARQDHDHGLPANPVGADVVKMNADNSGHSFYVETDGTGTGDQPAYTVWLQGPHDDTFIGFGIGGEINIQDNHGPINLLVSEPSSQVTLTGAGGAKLMGTVGEIDLDLGGPEVDIYGSGAGEIAVDGDTIAFFGAGGNSRFTVNGAGATIGSVQAKLNELLQALGNITGYGLITSDQ